VLIEARFADTISAICNALIETTPNQQVNATHTKIDGLEGVTMVGTLRKERTGREAKGVAGPTGRRSRVEES
jgi:hypothetical protein